MLEFGEDDYLGEWISRRIGFKTPPLVRCEITRGATEDRLCVRHESEPFSSRAKRTDSSKEHVLVFHFPGRDVTTGISRRIAVAYDRYAIIGIGNGPTNKFH
jgi:hypothetical protein